MKLLAAALLLCVACGSKRAEHVITMSGMTFSPASLTIQSGDVVIWRNDDLVAHTATAAGRFDSGSLAAGAEYRVTITRSGTVGYGCTLHPMMKGTIIVK